MSLHKLIGLALTTLIAGSGCGDDLVDDELGTVSENEIPVERRGVIPLRQGYLGGKRVDYFRVGSFVPSDSTWFPRYDKFPGMPTRELYVFADAAGGLGLGDQRPIVDHLPLQANASDFLELVVVRAPAGYRANEIKSRATLLRAEYPLERTGLVVSCPLVGTDGRLGVELRSSRKLVLWYRKQTVHCQLLDGGVALFPEGMGPLKKFITTVSSERAEVRAAAGDVYMLRANVFTGADLAPAIAVPKNDIFRHAPGDTEYTPLAKIWDVTMPSDYSVGQITSYEALFPIPDFTDPRITARSPDAFCNCPIVAVK
jgi:hypothetical protein